LPVGGGLLYVQPVYVQSSGGTQFPLLRKVLVSFGEDIGFADTLTEALDQVFGGDSGAVGGDAEEPDVPLVPNEPADPGATPEPTPTDGPTTSPTAEPTTPAAGSAQERLSAALQAANAAMREGQAALARGDFAAYGEAQDRLNRALADA